MKKKLQPVRGTKDLLFSEAENFAHIVKTAKQVSNLYGFKPAQVPIFEFTEVFKRTLGDTSDVVNKEMYSFEDKGGDLITLRPEFTAGIARAFISNGLQQNLPLKLFTYGPLFRYERPQKGRQRQFHQVNFEWLGEKEPYADVEIITLATQILKKLGITGAKLNLNSLGDKESRNNYRNKLVEYLQDYKNDLSEDSKNRLEKNPLRILDSKDSDDKEIIKNAPSMQESFNTESKEFFDKVQAGLKLLNIDFVINNRIVRGLDYYTHTVFEFISDSEELGAQNTLVAGGRYDGLIAQMGGPETPAIGFAAGIERLMLVSNYKKEAEELVAFLPIGEEATKKCIDYADAIRTILGKKCEIIYGNNLKKKFQKVDKMQIAYAVITGDNELRDDLFILRNMKTGEEQKYESAALAEIISSLP